MSSARTSSSADSSPGRILAIDYGQKRIGLALSDEMGLTAQPLQTLQRTNRRNDVRRLRDIARRNGVRRIIVGHPVHLDGSESEMAAEAARFAVRIQKELGLPVELADERLSSWEAEQVLAEGRKKRRGEAVDHVAAAIILRDYLARAKRKKERA
jgi:putative Holliday junction resolvase